MGRVSVEIEELANCGCPKCGQSWADGDVVKLPGGGYSAFHVLCPDGRAETSVVCACCDDPLIEPDLEARIARAGYSESAVVSAWDGRVRLFQALVYRRGCAVGVVFLCWPSGITEPLVLNEQGAQLRPGVDRAEWRNDGDGLAVAGFGFLEGALRAYARMIEENYRVARAAR